MYLKSAWRALGKIYYHLLQMGNVSEFKLVEEEIGNEEAEFRAKQLIKVTRHLKEVATLYEYLGREVNQTGTLNKLENGYYGISGSDTYYCTGSLIEYYDMRINQYEISTVDFDGTDYYIVGYPLSILGAIVRIRGYRDEKQV